MLHDPPCWAKCLPCLFYDRARLLPPVNFYILSVSACSKLSIFSWMSVYAYFQLFTCCLYE